MQKSFVVKSPINFANFGFFVRVGDTLLHDSANGNKLTVYRNGEIVRAITQTALGMAALLKQGFIAEVVAHHHNTAPVAPKASEAPKKASPASPSEPRKEKPKAKAVAAKSEAPETEVPVIPSENV